MKRSLNRIAGRWLIIVLHAAALSGCSFSAGDSQQKQTGGNQPKGEIKAQDPGEIELLVVDDPNLADAVERQWTRRSNDPLKVKKISLEEFRQSLVGARRLKVDAVIFPTGMLGELVERRLLAPIPKSIAEGRLAARDDLLDMVRLQETTWGGEIYAFSLGSPLLTLQYRRDLFETHGLKPPRTWAEHRELVDKLKQLQAGQAQGPQAGQVLEPLAPGWASQMLLARAACYVRRRSQYSALFHYLTMKPLIDGPPFVRALEELARAAKTMPADAKSLTPDQIRQRFAQGKCAMAITWPVGPQATTPTAAESPEQHPLMGSTTGGPQRDGGPQVQYGFAPLPGSLEAYNLASGQWETRPDTSSPYVPLLGVSGRLGGVARYSRRTSSAMALLARVSGQDWSSQISPYSRATSLFRADHFSSPQTWMETGVDEEAAHQYVQSVQEAQRQGLWMFSLRIPGRESYLTALDEAVRSVVDAGEEPAAALKKTAAKWRRITTSLDADKQQKAYERSLGLDP